MNPPNLVLISPMDSFQIIWMKLPLLAAIFLASPWVVYQLWAFIAPGLYKHERRWAVPFVTTSAGLFILGGLFAYFVSILSSQDFFDWGWRYPFFVAFAINVVALFARLRMVARQRTRST